MKWKTSSAEKVRNQINVYQNISKIPNQRKKIVPGNRNYPDITSFGKKILIVGDSYLKKIKRNKLNNSFSKAKCIIKSFSGTKIQDLGHYLTPHLEHDKPDIAVIHIGSNNVSYNNLI